MRYDIQYTPDHLREQIRDAPLDNDDMLASHTTDGTLPGE